MWWVHHGQNPVDPVLTLAFSWCLVIGCLNLSKQQQYVSDLSARTRQQWLQASTKEEIHDSLPSPPFPRTALHLDLLMLMTVWTLRNGAVSGIVSYTELFEFSLKIHYHSTGLSFMVLPENVLLLFRNTPKMLFCTDAKVIFTVVHSAGWVSDLVSDLCLLYWV